MNNCVFYGRIVKDLEPVVMGDKKVVNFNLAVRRTKDKADFVQCEAWGTTVDLLMSKCSKKGNRVIVECEYRNNSYQVEGETRHKHYFLVNNVSIIDWDNTEDNGDMLP